MDEERGNAKPELKVWASKAQEAPAAQKLMGVAMSVLELKPTDRLVVSCQDALDPDELEELAEQLEEVFPEHFAEDKIIILQGGATLGVIREGNPLIGNAVNASE